MAGEHCSAACVTKDHETFGQCLRAKSLKIAAVDSTVNGSFVKAGDQ